MRDVLCRSLLKSAENPAFVFLTGDLGFNCFEHLREAMGERFINAGIAEQNMISVAAGLAKTGLRPWTYSIAPFIYARPFEQIRNDICFHDVPVILVGNGGGYAYGVMGPTHHALEDYGTLLTLPNLQVFIPAFDHDIEILVPNLFRSSHPAYLRLGRSELPHSFHISHYAPFRQLLSGDGCVILVVGPLAGGILDVARQLPESIRPCVWVLCELPLPTPPRELIAEIANTGHLCVVEEHVTHGSAGAMLAAYLLANRCAPRKFTHYAAKGYPSGQYGSQQFHRSESGLAPQDILKNLTGTSS